jgi:GNAT superfamily N-acetyltransferase
MIRITPLTEADLPAFVALLEEMDRFYGVVEFEPAEARTAQVKALLLHDSPAAHVLLARADDDVIGLASYSYLWPASGLTRSLFLKELYVARACRGRGVGGSLMRRLFDLAVESGCSRVDWMTDRANLDAQAFYARLGHTPNTGKVFYRAQASR